MDQQGVERRRQKSFAASEGNLSQEDQFTPKASGRSQKRPRLLFGAPRPSSTHNNSKGTDESPPASSNETTSTNTTARSILFGGSSRRSISSKDAVADSTMLVEATKLSATSQGEDEQSRMGANDDALLQSPTNKRSSLFGKVMQNVQRTPSRPAASVANFLDNFSPYAKTPSTPFSPTSVDPNEWREAPLDEEWFDFGLYNEVELEGLPRMDLSYDDATALREPHTNDDDDDIPPSLSSAQVYHRFPPSIFSSLNRKISKQEWRSAFRSLYFRWKGLDRESYFYLFTTTQASLFRKRIDNDGTITAEITFSKCRFGDTLRQRHGVPLYLAAKWNKHAQGTEWDDTMMLHARKKLNVSPATKAELQALNNAPTVGADITVQTTSTAKTGLSSLPPLFVTGQDACDAVYECYMNLAPVDALLVSRDGAFLHSTLDRLSPPASSSSSTNRRRRSVLEGPILPCAIAALCQAAAHIATNSSSNNDEAAYWLLTATSPEATLLIAWDKERPDIVAYKKR
jgi:hypothetical protein